MSIHGSARVTTVPGARTGTDPAVGPAPTGALFAPTGEHVGLSPVAKAMTRPGGRSGHPVPSGRRLFGLCVAAAALGLGGILIGARGWLGLVMHKAAGWYLPAIVILGVAGILTAAGGFLTVHRRHAPWALICVSAAILVTAMVVTAVGIS